MDDSERAPLVRVICGPTAAGKTRAALALARSHAVSIVSADSRQLYRGFDIGTAKPSHEERTAVPHEGVDVLEPMERASAAWWAERADGWIRTASAQARVPLVVGGTGLYLRALFGALFEEPPMDADARRALQQELGALSVAELRRWVERLDPARAHLGRTQLLRALEIALLTGRRMSELHAERRTTPRWRARYLVVDPGDRLQRDIRARVESMIAEGWVEEVERLVETVPEDAPAWNASGYGAIRDVVQGRARVAHAVERVTIETRQYAKRQRTWFRHQLAGEDVTRVDPARDGWEEVIETWWHESDG